VNNRRKLVIALGAGALAAPFGLFAQQRRAKIAQIGILNSESASDSSEQNRAEALRQGLRELGHEEGNNIVIEYRWAEGKYGQLPGMAADLVRLNVDLIVSFGIKATAAAMRATTTIPIVLPGTAADVVGLGLIASFARPGGNLTGSTTFGPEIMAKRLELLKDAMPRVSRVAVLVNPANTSFGPMRKEIEIAAKSLKLRLQAFEVRAPSEFGSVFTAIAKARVDATVFQDDTMFRVNSKVIVDHLIAKRLPSVGSPAFGNGGGLIGYGVDQFEMYRRAATTIDKILKGANPGDLPFERATKFEMVVNLQTAKALGIRIPNSILVQATKVIE
jgi:putative ABC transport system substrate-binding protein